MPKINTTTTRIIINRLGEMPKTGEVDMKIKVEDAVEIISTSPGRAGKRDLMVRYSVDEDRSYLLSIPMEKVSTPEGTIDPAKVKSELEATEKERAKLIGLEFEV
jgi:hypothetical protein